MKAKNESRMSILLSFVLRNHEVPSMPLKKNGNTMIIGM
jgi:hypothetical protein